MYPWGVRNSWRGFWVSGTFIHDRGILCIYSRPRLLGFWHHYVCVRSREKSVVVVWFMAMYVTQFMACVISMFWSRVICLAMGGLNGKRKSLRLCHFWSQIYKKYFFINPRTRSTIWSMGFSFWWKKHTHRFPVL